MTTSQTGTSHTDTDKPGVKARIPSTVAMKAKHTQLATGNPNDLKTSG